MLCNKCGKETNMIHDLCTDCQKELNEQDKRYTEEKNNNLLNEELEAIENLADGMLQEASLEADNQGLEYHGNRLKKRVIEARAKLIIPKKKAEFPRRLEAVEKLREIYQNLQDENEESKNDDGSGKYTSDGEWLDQFVVAVAKLLEFESRP